MVDEIPIDLILRPAGARVPGRAGLSHDAPSPPPRPPAGALRRATHRSRGAYVVWTMASSAWRAGPTRVVGAARQSAHRGRLGRSPPALATNTEMVLVELGSRRAGRARARLPLPLAEASKLGDELYEAIRKLHWSYLRAATSHPSFALSAIAQRETGSRAAGWPACRRRQGKSSGPTRSGRPRQEAAVLYDPVISKEGLLDVTGESTRGTPKRRLRRNPSAPWADLPARRFGHSLS